MSALKLKIYEYAACSTCKKALKYLELRRVNYEKIPIVDQPPTKVELQRMLGHLKAHGGSFKKLFNTSGVLYKEMKMADKISQLSETEALDLLAKHGKLIKRPFVLGRNFGLVGFNEEEWEKYLG